MIMLSRLFNYIKMYNNLIMIKNNINPKQLLIDKIKERGGWVNSHSHIDRAFILNTENFHLVNDSLQQKWDYPDIYKSKVTVEEIYQNMVLVVDDFIAQGGQAIASFIDVDPIIKDKAIKAAEKFRSDYKDKIKIKFINQVVKGVIEPEARRWFEIGAEFADIIGGLPEKDKGHEAEHLDILFKAAKKYDKLIHVHIDQYNSPDQRDTELLVRKTIEHDYRNKVVAIHCISVGAQPKEYRHQLYRKMIEAGIMVISCPISWIDNSVVSSKQGDVIGPIHNAMTPVKEMIEAGLIVSIGTDNIQDIYKPFDNGDMWDELHFLIEGQQIYDLKVLTDIATINGLLTLGLE